MQIFKKKCLIKLKKKLSEIIWIHVLWKVTWYRININFEIHYIGTRVAAGCSKPDTRNRKTCAFQTRNPIRHFFQHAATLIRTDPIYQFSVKHILKIHKNIQISIASMKIFPKLIFTKLNKYYYSMTSNCFYNKNWNR